tara:strand:+ start:778 stop:1086 length:309 start_codon:yes stop_codon:yes gene_type:complete
MAKETKFSDDELKSLSDLAQGYQTTQAAFGQLRVQKILLAQQQDGLEEAEVKLEADYITLQENERKIVKQLNEKYGPGSLDPQTGVFTPIETDSAEETSEES